METTRRHFLRGAVAASALASASPAIASTAPAENPDLIALGRDFDDAYAAWTDAATLVAELQPVYRAMAPQIPSEISGGKFERFFGWDCAEVLRDPACPKLSDVRGADGHRLLVVKAYHLERNFAEEDMSPSLRRLYRMTVEYEAATEEALQSSGLAAALASYHAADGTLRRVVYSMSLMRARTPAGLAIKIRATGVYAGLGSEERFSAGQWLANAMWTDLEEMA